MSVYVRNGINPPAGIPHATSEEDTYMGYRIPKGAIIVPNVWY